MRRPYGRKMIMEDDYDITDCGFETPCWIWRWAKANGYGRVWLNGSLHQAHKVMYEQETGRIASQELDHLCDVRACIRPDHLQDVSHAENILRARERHSWETVLKIRADPRSTYKIAADLGIPVATVYFIKSGRQRKHH